MKTIVAVLSIFLISLFVACSSTKTSSPTSSTPPKAAEAGLKREPVLYTAKSCMSQMAGLAMRWQRDAVPFHMESGLNAESQGHEGKATIWRAMFASPSSGTYRTFTCSGSRLRDEAPIGVTATAETPYGGDVPRLMFQPLNLITDSDQAFALAQEKGGAKLLEKDPNQPVVYALDWDSRERQLLWLVIYGTSRKDNKGMGVINATTGKFLHAAK